MHFSTCHSSVYFQNQFWSNNFLTTVLKDFLKQVIECNLRASRSLPFVSKTYDFDFVGLATRCMMSEDYSYLQDSLKPVDISVNGRVGVKVSFSIFSALQCLIFFGFRHFHQFCLYAFSQRICFERKRM